MQISSAQCILSVCTVLGDRMSRRSRRRRSTDRTDAIASQIANPRLFRPTPLIVTRLPPVHRAEVEDRRTHHPLGFFRPARMITGHPSHLVAKPGPAKFRRASLQVPKAIAFEAPKKTLICVRRKQRKEVLHALKKTGKGGGKRRRPRRNWYSAISC